MRPLLILVPLALVAAACGGSDSDVTQLASTLPPTACASGTFETGRTITIKVDDVVDGFGGMSSRTPSDLAAGTVRLSIEADAENEQPVTVTLTREGSEVTVVRGVPAGSVCAVDIDLQPGHYVAVEGDRDVEFDIVGGA